MIHVCSLARLHDTVTEVGASHIVTLLRLIDRVQRPATNPYPNQVFEPKRQCELIKEGAST